MSYFKKLVGSRIYLSPINPDDANIYTEWLNDLEVTINLGSSARIYSLEMEREKLEKVSKNGNHFAIVDLRTDEVIGNCGLGHVDNVNRSAELAIFIGNKGYWSQGYGTESINLLLEYGFQLLNLNSIFLRVNSFNQRAFRCYQKCGFKEIGRRREAIIFGEKKFDQIYMDVLASEFQSKILDELLNSL